MTSAADAVTRPMLSTRLKRRVSHRCAPNSTNPMTIASTTMGISDINPVARPLAEASAASWRW